MNVWFRMFQLSNTSIPTIYSGTGNDHGDVGAQASIYYVVPLLPILTREHNDTLGPEYQCQLGPYVQETVMFGIPFTQCSFTQVSGCRSLWEALDGLL